jgi:hypothetical protein
MAVFWIVASIALIMEAARSSETLVNFYQTTRHYNPEDSHQRVFLSQTWWKCNKKITDVLAAFSGKFPDVIFILVVFFSFLPKVSSTTWTKLKSIRHCTNFINLKVIIISLSLKSIHVHDNLCLTSLYSFVLSENYNYRPINLTLTIYTSITRLPPL